MSTDHQLAPEVATTAPGTASVAICAYTLARWSQLLDAIDSVRTQLRPGDECLVIIDHNNELLDAVRSELVGLPDLRILPSTGLRGLSGARNTAIAAATGAVVAFLDDDAVAEPGWLEQLRSALAQPLTFGVGTAALPIWPDARRPAWLTPEYDWVVGCSYLGLPTRAADVRNVIGATMAFRREVFDLAGDFSTTVGRIGALPMGCEETELCIRLRQRMPSARVTYLPEVRVHHRVSADRLRLSYFVRRCFNEGRSKARVSRLVGAQAALASERAYVRSVLPRAVVRELGAAIRGRASGVAAATMIVVGLFAAGLGYVREQVRAGR